MLDRIHSIITNDLRSVLVPGELFAGIIGDQPSKGAKSPSIWNPTFRALDVRAVFVAFDVMSDRLGALMDALRACPDFLGGSVTMPHKVAVIRYLDDLDPMANRIGAVNAIVRTQDGRLVGYNTDGKGGIDSLTLAQPGQAEPFLPSLQGFRVTLLGAGGAARALAFYLAEAVGPQGALTIVNRDLTRAEALARDVKDAYGNATGAPPDALADLAPRCDLLVNATTVGQGGLRPLASGTATCLEPFSPLAPCAAPSRPYGGDAKTFLRPWLRDARSEIERNNARSLAVLLDTPESVRVWDIVYSPLETVLLHQARLSGHVTLNGKSMNVAQAADAFFNRVCRAYLEERFLWNDQTYRRILETMNAVW